MTGDLLRHVVTVLGGLGLVLTRRRWWGSRPSGRVGVDPVAAGPPDPATSAAPLLSAASDVDGAGWWQVVDLVRLQDWHIDYVEGDSLLDAYVFDAGLFDWQRLLDVVRSQGWPIEYVVDRSPLQLPGRVGDIFAASRRGAYPSLLIRPTTGLEIVTDFLAEDEIEFVLDARELRDQRHLDALRAFLRTVGTGLDKPVVLTPADVSQLPLIRYLPAEDRFTRHTGPQRPWR
ncbi:hypothetical protein OG799_15260 [Micromonospora sp. NBC_00898]|uniref:hypothetical protein n=1 Tax=Micromonospora sp. NBC_00898 TaxID=2975981 RepID=UPI003869D115|nr:hypothetical protein OG799_15260 [Micromonospora sp. NBC_00898]